LTVDTVGAGPWCSALFEELGPWSSSDVPDEGELVVEVRVESRDSIVPTFRLPIAPVRVTEAVVGCGGLEPPNSA
jgi:hypothetical protein